VGRKFPRALALSVVLPAFILAYSPSYVRAQVPNPSMSDVPNPFHWAPNGGGGPSGNGRNIVTVRDALGTALPGITVTLTLTTGVSPCVCAAPVTVFTQTTNINGEAWFALYGGGCLLASMMSGVSPGTVDVGGVFTVDVDFISPDIVDDNGQPSSPNSPCVFGLTDLVWIATNTGFGGAPYNGCADFDDDGVEGTLGDIFMMTYLVEWVVGCP